MNWAYAGADGLEWLTVLMFRIFAVVLMFALTLPFMVIGFIVGSAKHGLGIGEYLYDYMVAKI